MSHLEHPDNVDLHSEVFSAKEVGITHPYNDSHIRIDDSGKIELVAGRGVAIVLDPNHGTIALMADKIRFLSRDDGLQWNRHAFNPKAHSFDQPALMPVSDLDMYDGLDAYSKRD